MNPSQNPVATAAAAGGVATSLAIMLMYAMNAIWHITFPPEVSVAFTTVVTWILHLTCVKLGCGPAVLNGQSETTKSEVKP